MLRDTVDAGAGGVQFRQDPTTGILTFWDTSRLMFLGVDRENYEYGIDHKNIRVPMWMMITSRIKSLANGSLIPRNSIITCYSSNSSGLTDCEFEIYRLRLGTKTILSSFQMLNEDSKIVDSLNISLDADDELSILCKPLNGKVVNYPSLTIEIAWR